MNANKSAFPSQGTMSFVSPGLTKREYFAALAMQGMLANPQCSPFGMNFREQSLAERAAQMADAQLAELAKAQP